MRRRKSVNRRVRDGVKTLNSIVKDSELVVLPTGTMQSIEWFKILAISGKPASKRSKSHGYKVEEISYLVYEALEELLAEHFKGNEGEFVGMEWFEPAQAIGLPMNFAWNDYKGLKSQATKPESIIKSLIKKASGAKAKLRPVEMVTTYEKTTKSFERATETLERQPRRQERLEIQSQRRPEEFIEPEVEQSMRFVGPDIEDMDQYRAGLPTETYYEPEAGLAEILEVEPEELDEQGMRQFRRQKLRKEREAQQRLRALQAGEVVEDELDEDLEPSEEQLMRLEEEEDFYDDGGFVDEDEYLEEVAGRRGWVGATQRRKRYQHPRLEGTHRADWPGPPCDVDMRVGTWVRVPDEEGFWVHKRTIRKPYQYNGEWVVDVRYGYGDLETYPLADCRSADPWM